MSNAIFSALSNAVISDHAHAVAFIRPMRARKKARRSSNGLATAIVYCEANFGSIDGKTANGLVRHSEKYEILSVIDSKKAGLDAGEVLGDAPNEIPVCRDLAAAMALAGGVPDYYIYRHGAREWHVVVARALAGARGHRPRHEHRERPPRVPQRRSRVRGRQRREQRDDPRRPQTARQEGPAHVQRPHHRGHLSAYRRAWHRLRDRQAHHGRHPDPRAQRARTQGGDGRHRSDRPDPGRALRRRARRHPVAVLLGRDGGDASSKPSKASAPT